MSARTDACAEKKSHDDSGHTGHARSSTRDDADVFISVLALLSLSVFGVVQVLVDTSGSNSG
jgi:hypothetical protein